MLAPAKTSPWPVKSMDHVSWRSPGSSTRSKRANKLTRALEPTACSWDDASSGHPYSCDQDKGVSLVARLVELLPGL